MKKKASRKQEEKVIRKKKTAAKTIKYLIRHKHQTDMLSLWFEHSPWVEMSSLSEVQKWLAANGTRATDVKVYEVGGELKLKNRLELEL